MVYEIIPTIAYMGVSNNRGTPKWMVKRMENPIQMDDLRGKPENPRFLETPMYLGSFFLP